MRRNPIFVFDDRNSLGLDAVPLDAIVQVTDAGDPDGRPTMAIYKSRNNITSSTEVGDFLDGPNFINLDTDTLSELAKVTEGGKTGWKLLGSDSNNYGTIGEKAIDLSVSITPGAYGAIGDYSFAVGSGTIAKNTNSIAMGAWNVGTSSLTIFEFGNGNQGNPSNALEIHKNGIIVAPNSEMDDIVKNVDKTLVTKEYVNFITDNKISAKTTTDIAEGINLYYTEARDTYNFNENIILTSLDQLKDVDMSAMLPTNGQVLKFDGTNWVPSSDSNSVVSVNGHVGVVNIKTDDILEGTTNFYFTETRDAIAFNNHLTHKTTDDLSEGANNKYYDASLVASTLGTVPIGSLSNVDTTGATVDQALLYDDITQEWKPGTVPPSAVTSINGLVGDANLKFSDLEDVKINGYVDGYVVKWNVNGDNTWGISPENITSVIDSIPLVNTGSVGALSANQGRLLNNLITINTDTIHQHGIQIPLKEPSLPTTYSDGDILSVDGNGNRSWVPLPSAIAAPIDNLIATDSDIPLSANMGRELNSIKENSLGNPSTSGFILASTFSGIRSWVAAPAGSLVIDDLVSTDSSASLSSNMGRELKSLTGANAHNITINSNRIDASFNNITAIENSVTANARVIATNTGDIATNVTDIATNVTDIATNVIDIDTNAVDIAALTPIVNTSASTILTHTTDIIDNTANITTNTADINTNKTDINTNTTNIATNKTDIGANKANIATNKTDINNNGIIIGNNTSAIATNTGNITTNTTNIGKKEDYLNNPGNDGDILSSLANGTRTWITPAAGSTVIANLITSSDTSSLSASMGLQLDSNKLDKAGGVVNGLIECNPAPINGDDLTNKTYVDLEVGSKFDQIGGVINGIIICQEIPQNDNDLTNKLYVDNLTKVIDDMPPLATPLNTVEQTIIPAINELKVEIGDLSSFPPDGFGVMPADLVEAINGKIGSTDPTITGMLEVTGSIETINLVSSNQTNLNVVTIGQVIADPTTGVLTSDPTTTGDLTVSGPTKLLGNLEITGSITGPNATLGIQGLLPGLIAAIPDSTATDIASLVLDYNNLLASLRTAGILV